uniref:Ig-like domain-containing protein n=1 Tax=Pelusios castaneus TaxID=367368 RepID=A0A8C8SES8_9SAUR
ANITIRCQGLHWDMRFFLHKAGDLNPQEHKGPAGDGTEFHIPNMGRQHGGRYSCSFRPQSELFISSEPSDPVELVVAGEGGDSTFPLPAPHPVRPWWVFFPGGTVLCVSQPVSFGSQSPLCPLDLQALPAPRDGGGVRCWRDRRTERDRRAEDRMRRTRFVSPPLNAGLFVNPEGPYPKPSISVSPAGVIPVGGNVTIRCWQHHYPGLRIQLYRDGIWNYLNYMDPAGSEAEFPIPSVSREHGGSYQCRYSDISGTYSEPSDPVEIIVAGEPDPGLPRPAISLRPSSVPAPGANVTIRCEGPGRAVRFFLHKAGDLNLQEHVDPAGDWTEFRIPDVGRHHGGRYSCSYRPRSQPFVSSEPSDPMELLVAGEGPNSASRLPAPHADNRTPWGGDCSPVGRPEPGSVLSPRAQQRDTRPGNRDGVMGGVPGGAAATEGLWPGRGIHAPGFLSQGELPHLRGFTEESRLRPELLNRPHPQPQTPPSRGLADDWCWRGGHDSESLVQPLPF